MQAVHLVWMRELGTRVFEITVSKDVLGAQESLETIPAKGNLIPLPDVESPCLKVQCVSSEVLESR